MRSSKRNGWLSSLIRLQVMGCVVSLTSLVWSATDHVVESDCNSGSRSKLELSANVHRLVSLGLSVSHGLPPPRDASNKAGGQGPRGVSGRESAGHFQNVICMCHARQKGPFRQGLAVVPAGSYR